MPKFNQFEKIIIDRINKRVKELDNERFSSKAMAKKARRIGSVLTLQTKKNIRNHTMIDSGRLLNSIQSKSNVTSDGFTIEFGSWGVKYAAMNEFGGPFTDRQRRAMFASLRRAGKLKKGRKSKGVIVGDYWRPRPFIRPSLIAKRAIISKILMESAS